MIYKNIFHNISNFIIKPRYKMINECNKLTNYKWVHMIIRKYLQVYAHFVNLHFVVVGDIPLYEGERKGSGRIVP